MAKGTPRIYVDTSVFGGVFDKEFAEPSKIFFYQARQGFFHLVTSVIVEDEVFEAPQRIRDYFGLFSGLMETVKIREDAVGLQFSYIQAGIVTEKSALDALHVAMATVSGCTAIVSWNFKHIVNFQRIPKYNAVNILKGYSNLSILSPQEVIRYEDRDA